MASHNQAGADRAAIEFRQSGMITDIALATDCVVGDALTQLGLEAPAAQLIERCPPKARVKPAGAKSAEERVLYCNGL